MNNRQGYCIAPLSSNSARAGFSLLELMMATCIGLLGLSAAMSMASWQIRSTHNQQMISEATAVGQEQLEVFDQMAFSDIVAGTAEIDEFQLKWTVSDVDRCKVVRVSIHWGEQRKKRQLVLSSLYAESAVNGYVYTK